MAKYHQMIFLVQKRWQIDISEIIIESAIFCSIIDQTFF